MYYVGLDVHQSRSSVEILDCNGKLVKRTQVLGRWPVLFEELKKVPRPFGVCFEASCGYGYLYEEFSKLTDQVKVAHPGALAWIYKSKKKHDRVDASKLAKLLFLDLVPTVHVPSRQVRAWRQTIEFRQKLLRLRVMAKNQVRAFLKERGIAPPKSLWTRKSRAWLKTLELEEADALRRDLLIDQLEESDQKLKRVDKYLNQVVDKHPAVTLLRTIPGVGPRTAEALVAYIDDVKRFSSVKCAGAYFGLVPCEDTSADKARLGHITRDGPGTVRKLLCEAAWAGIRRSLTIKSYYERITRDDPDRKKIAIVAVAHYLVRVAVAMLRTGDCWRERVREKTKKSEAPGGGGENPSRPQGFSPPPSTAPESESHSTPPPLSASPFSPQGRKASGAKVRRRRDSETVKTEETIGA